MTGHQRLCTRSGSSAVSPAAAHCNTDTHRKSPTRLPIGQNGLHACWRGPGCKAAANGVHLQEQGRRGTVVHLVGAGEWQCTAWLMMPGPWLKVSCICRGCARHAASFGQQPVWDHGKASLPHQLRAHIEQVGGSRTGAAGGQAGLDSDAGSLVDQRRANLRALNDNNIGASPTAAGRAS